MKTESTWWTKSVFRLKVPYPVANHCNWKQKEFYETTQSSIQISQQIDNSILAQLLAFNPIIPSHCARRLPGVPIAVEWTLLSRDGMVYFPHGSVRIMVFGPRQRYGFDLNIKLLYILLKK